MAYIWEQFSRDPAENNKAAPYGAPEGQVQINLFTDICRVLMASIREVADIAITTGGVIGTMGIQNKHAVDITGGNVYNVGISNAVIDYSNIIRSNINSSNFVDGGAIKSGIIPLARIPLQALYNIMYPVGTRRLYLHSDASDLYWGSSVAAQWAWFGAAAGHALMLSGGPTGHAIGAGAGAYYLGDSTYMPTLGAVGGGFTAVGLTGASGVLEHSHLVPLDIKRYGVAIATRVA